MAEQFKEREVWFKYFFLIKIYYLKKSINNHSSLIDINY